MPHALLAPAGSAPSFCCCIALHLYYCRLCLPPACRLLPWNLVPMKPSVVYFPVRGEREIARCALAGDGHRHMPATAAAAAAAASTAA